MNPRQAALATAALAFATSCQPRSFNPTRTTSTIHFSGKDVLSALDSAPGSEARRGLADVLEKEVVRGKLADRARETPSAPDEDAQQQLTERFLSYTVQALRASEACPKSERIRLFRGVSRAPSAAPAGSPHRFRGQLFGSWYGNLGQALSRMPWETHFWDLKFLINAAGGDEEIDLRMRWDNLTRAHTIDSEGSPLVSATLRYEVAKRFSDGTILELEVCPGRALPVTDPRYLSEFEFYLPLMVFPEEIIGVNPAPPPVELPRREAAWTCFANLGEELDVNALREEAVTVNDSGGDWASRPQLRYVHRYAAFRNTLYASAPSSIGEWISHWKTSTSACQPDCSVARETLQKFELYAEVREGLERPATASPLAKAFVTYRSAVAERCPR